VIGVVPVPSGGRLGHASTGFTLDVYSHAVTGMDPDTEVPLLSGRSAVRISESKDDERPDHVMCNEPTARRSRGLWL
jgi:hypothetical protein